MIVVIKISWRKTEDLEKKSRKFKDLELNLKRFSDFSSGNTGRESISIRVADFGY